MNKLELLENLFAAFPSSHPTQQTFNVYLEALENVPVEELAVAVKQIIRDGGAFPPSAGDLIKAASRPPGPGVPTPQRQMNKPIPTTFYRLPEDEDKQQRMAQLRRTRNWRY